MLWNVSFTTIICAVAILNNDLLAYANNSIPKQRQSRVTLDGYISSQLPIHNDPPVIEPRKELIFKTRMKQEKEWLYTSIVTFNGKPAFLKCSQKENIYKKELNILMKIKNAKLKPEQKECLKLENPTDYIIQHYDNFSTRNGYNCIVMSSEENVQDLADYIENTDLTTIYKNAFPILNQLLTGVAYLHCINIAHTDIKPENIIVHLTSRRKPAIKIIDFDLALDLSIGPKQPMHCRTLGYCSPETFTPATVYEFFSNPPIIDLIKTDSWSIAATMRTYIDNLNPYGERLLANGAVSAMTYVDTRDIILKVLKENKHNYTPIHIPPHLINYADTFGIPDLMDFLEDLMMPNPKDRFTPIRTLQESVPYYKQFILPFAVSKMQH